MSNSPYRLLVVDDDEDICILLKDIFESRGYSIDTATSGRNALPLLAENKYSLVISDINMPFLNGEQLLKVLQKQFNDTPLIFITGQPDYQNAVDLVKQGASDYVGKPFSIDNIILKVETALKLDKENKRKIEVAEDSDKYKDGYRIIKHLGAGFNGNVLLVEKNNKEYAMKIIKLPNNNDQAKIVLKRFETEFFSMIKLDHPSIVKVFQFNIQEDNQSAYMIMEYVPGGTLADFIEKPSEIPQKISILIRLLEGINCLHNNHILHRDIKPQNILLDLDENPKLVDFGIAKISNNVITKTMEWVGSPPYMAPEMFTKEKIIDQRSDLFSLGTVMYELFTGIRAFPGKTVEEVSYNIKQKKLHNPSLLLKQLPPWVSYTLAGLLAKKPSQRFDTAQEALDFIRNNSIADYRPSFKEKISSFLKKRHKVWS